MAPQVEEPLLQPLETQLQVVHQRPAYEGQDHVCKHGA